jgi:hypothetical protein
MALKPGHMKTHGRRWSDSDRGGPAATYPGSVVGFTSWRECGVGGNLARCATWAPLVAGWHYSFGPARLIIPFQFSTLKLFKPNKLAKYETGTSRTPKIFKLCMEIDYSKRDNFHLCHNFEIPLDFELKILG